MSAEREVVRRAIVESVAATAAAAEAEDMLARARRYETKLADELAALADLDERIASARAEGLKIAFTNGVSPRLANPIEGFARDRIRRDFLTAELDGCRKSIEILEGELAQARDEAARCERARERAAERVVAKMAERMAIDFVQRLDELRRASYLLAAVVTRQVPREPGAPGMTPSVPGQLYGSGPYRSLDLPPVVHEAARENILGDFEYRHGAGLRKKAAAVAANLWERLKTDPDATLDDPPEPMGSPRSRRVGPHD